MPLAKLLPALERTSDSPDADKLPDRAGGIVVRAEAMARRGNYIQAITLFERAIVPAQWTIPSHASLFTGEYPTTHMINQIYNTLGDNQKTLAELLKAGGYKTVGFCNNPLLGAVENRLDRGFEEFYNYGGAIPNPPHISRSRPRVEARLFERNIRNKLE